MGSETPVWRYEGVLRRVDGKSGAVAHSGLFHHAANVRLHGADFNPERLGNFTIGTRRDQQLQDFQFSLRKLWNRMRAECSMRQYPVHHHGKSMPWGPDRAAGHNLNGL